MENLEKIRLPWPDWKIVKYLGGGAYGKVYEIERTISGTQEKEKAALKIVSRPKDEDEIEEYEVSGYDKESIIESYKSEIQNYVQEYKLMRTLQGQTNIVSCDDFTVIWNQNGIGGKVFIRMELLTPLNQVLKERALSTEEIIKLGKDITSALILCEKKNIIHRDIKPANIMVSQFGNYKLGDFGVSKIMDHATYATAMGTPEYQAPEVVHMGKYGQTADIYSLGIALYWLLNNRRMPFIGADEQPTVDQKNEAMERRYRGEKLPAPKNGSAKLKKIVLKACEYNPENRYASAQEMYDALIELKDEKALSQSIREEETARMEALNSLEADGETPGNSWGGGETIGELEEKKKKENVYEEIEKETIGVRNFGGEYQEEKKTANDNDLHMNVRISKIEVGQKTTVHVNYPDGRKKAFEIKVPENVSNGTIIRLKGQGKTITGDLLLHIAIKPGAEKVTDSEKDEDLHKTIQIKKSEIGKTVKLFVNSPDGQKKKLEVHIPENVSDGTILRLKGLGKTKDSNLLLHLEMSEEKTKGVKDAYQRQKEKEKKKERTTVVADVPVQAKKKSFELWKNVAILIFIVLIGYEFFIADGNLTKSSSSTGNSKYETKEEYYDDAETKLKTETRYKDGTIYDQDIYNEDGTKQKSVSYDKNGNIDHEFQYNAEGQRYKSISYDENGEIAYYSESEYNENGDEIKSTGYRANGSVQSITERQLLEDGTVVEHTDTNYDENGNITSKRVLECDDKGNSMKDSHYDANGTLCNYETYDYDDSGNSIGGTYYTKDGAAYAYWRYKGDGAVRKSVQYDTDGNEISLSELFEIKSEVGATF